MDRLLFRPDEVAQVLGVSRSKVYELLASGELTSVVVGGCRRVPVSALSQWTTPEATSGVDVVNAGMSKEAR